MEDLNKRSPIFQLMVESAPDAMILVDGAGIISLVNRQTEILFGYTRTELTGRNIEILLPTRYREHHPGFTKLFFNNPSARAMGAGRELFALKKDGSEVPVEIGLTPIQAAEPMVLASVIDITKRKQAEARFKALIENNIDAIVMLDENGFVIYTSPSTCKMMGYTKKEILGQHGNVFFHPDEIEVVMGRMYEAMKNPGKAIFTQNRVRHKDGHYIYTEGTTTNFLEDPDIKAFVGNFRDITDKKQAQDRLEQNEKRFRALIENNSEIIALRDKDGKLLYLSPGAKKTTGYTFDELRELEFKTAFNPEDVENVLNRFKESINKPGVPVTSLQRMKHKNGHYVWMEGTFTNLLDDKNVGAVVGNFKDVTARKVSEDKIQKNEKRFKALIENNSEIIALRDKESKLFYLSPGATKIIGYTLEELRDINFLDTIHPEDRESVQNKILKSINKPGVPIYGIQRTKHKDGHYIWLEGTITNLLDDENVVSIVGNFRDVTERKLDKDKLEQSEKRFRALIENNLDAISLHDNKGHILYQSPATERILGFTFEERRNKTIYDFAHPDDLPEVLNRLHEAMINPGLPVHGINRMLHKDGHYIWTEGTTTNLLHDESVNAMVGNFRDITDRKTAEEKLIRSNRLYALISEINKAIAHSADEQTLFSEACQIAVNTGKFDMAFINRLNLKSFNAALITGHNINEADIVQFGSYKFSETGLISGMIKNGKYSFVNDYEENPYSKSMGEYISNRGFNSSIALSIRKGEEIAYSFHIFSHQKDIFDIQELTLLSEITDDLSFALDIFEKEKLRREAEIKKNQAMRLYAFISAINQAIVHENEQQSLFDKTCRIAVEFGEFEFAQVCSVNEENSTINMIAQANASALEIEMFHNLTFEKTGATSSVLASGKCSYINDYEKAHKENNIVKYALRRGFRSGIVLPLKLSGKIIATLNLMSGQPDLFDEQEIRLLEEIADDISFALDVIEKETLRKVAEIKLRRNETRLKQAQEIAHLGSWEYNIGNSYARWSQEHCRIYEVDPSENKQSFESWLSMIHPEDQDFACNIVMQSRENLKDWDFNHRIILKNGTIRFIHCQSHFNFNDSGKPESIHGISLDITNQKEAEEKIINANRLYAFTSQINQAIVHLQTQEELFQSACTIAVETGKFELSFFCYPDIATKKTNLIAHCNATESDLIRYNNNNYRAGGFIDVAIQKGTYSIINDFETSTISTSVTDYAHERGFKSCIALPIKKQNNTKYVFFLYSKQKNLFDQQEINLLNRIANDLSFALDVFEKEAARKDAEEKMIHANRLYAFISQINQAIVHQKREKELLSEVCKIAVEIGQFEMTFISNPDQETYKTKLTSYYNATVGDLAVFDNQPFHEGGLTERVLKNGVFSVINDFDTITNASSVADFARQRGFGSAIALPLKKGGSLTYILFIFSGKKDFFDQHEIGLLKRTADDLSYALDVFVKEEERRDAEEKMIHANRLYAFISQINQAIVRSTDQQSVFKEACNIALEFGRFRAAWIGLLDKSGKILNLEDHCGLLPEDAALFTNYKYDINGIQGQVISSGTSYVCNNIQEDPVLANRYELAQKRGWLSCMILPIKKSGKVVGTFNILSDELNFFDNDEIALLEEATGDISFAMDNFEKDKLRIEFEKNLIHSELRLKQAQSIAHIGSWEQSFSTGKGIWSEETCNIYGVSKSDNLYTHEEWESFIHPEDLEYVRKVSNDELKSQGNTAFHHRIIRPDGEVRHVYSQASLEFSSNGAPCGLIGVVHDITETRKAEEALAQSEANLRLIIDLIPQSICARDVDGNYIIVNKSYASMYGFEPEQMINLNIRDIIPVKSEGTFFQDIDTEVIRSRKQLSATEHNFTDHKGNTRIFNTIKMPFIVAGPNIIASLSVINEITELKQIESERSKMIADIIQRNKDLEQFSYIVSHNLRSPVANIMGITEVLQYPELNNGDKLSMINDLNVCVNKLDEVIRDLNFVLQIKAKQGYKNESVKFSKILEDIINSIYIAVKNEKVQIFYNFDQVDELYSLKSYIHSIFYNLISNSIKYRQPGLNPIIEIKSELNNNKIHLTYKDNGMGIDLAKSGQYVFGLYKRFHSHVDGKGMGLFMVKTQIESLGGKISVESEVNKGTTFHIELNSNLNT